MLYVAEPLDACSTLTNRVEPTNNFTKEPFVLIVRGGCSFEDKVRKAQAAGFKAAIIYDNSYGDIIASNELFHCTVSLFISPDQKNKFLYLFKLFI